jgi:superfamily II DNA or RNA helicase
MTVLRPYQAAAVDSLRLSYRSGKRAPLYQLPTGAGKTLVFSYIVSGAANRGRSAWIIVHRQELLLQASRKLSEFNVEHGVIAPGHSGTRDPIQVVSVQTIARRLKTGRLGAFRPDLLVIDEAHHAPAKTWTEVLGAFSRARLLGVTATPARLDGRGLSDIFDDLILGPSIGELIGQGYLVQPICYAPPGANLKGVHSRYGDYVKSEAERAVDQPTITGDAIDHYRRLGEGMPGIAFCVSIDHAQHVAAQFNAAGIRAASIDGGMSDGERQNLIRALSNGGLRVLTSCDLVSEGTDIPVAGVAILLRPTQSLGMHLQQVGRVLRPAPGKTKAVVLDHVGNTAKHGLPDEERVWTLTEGAVKRKAGDSTPPVRQCPKCYATHRPAPRCPGCGHVYQGEAREIVQVEGQLEKVDPALAKLDEDFRRREEVRLAKSRDELLRIARARGYREGWVEHVLRARGQGRPGYAAASGAGR